MATRVRRVSATATAAKENKQEQAVQLRKLLGSIQQQMEKAKQIQAQAKLLMTELQDKMKAAKLTEITTTDAKFVAHWVTPEGRGSYTVDSLKFYDACINAKMLRNAVIALMDVTRATATATLPGKVVENMTTYTPPEKKEAVFVVEPIKKSK